MEQFLRIAQVQGKRTEKFEYGMCGDDDTDAQAVLTLCDPIATQNRPTVMRLAAFAEKP